VRRTALLAAAGLSAGIVLLLSATSAASGGPGRAWAAGPSPAGPIARAVAVAGKHKSKPRRSGCGAACRQLGIPQGEGGAYCGAPPWLTTASVKASTTLSVPAAEINPVNAGDLLLAAIDSQTGGIVPPPGWTEVPNTDYSVGTSEQLQVFYEIPVPLSAPHTLRAHTYLFRSPTPQAMTGTLTDFEGVSQSQPITAAGGEANPASSNQVLAPSITPTVPNSVLVFVGATSGAEKWTAPPGMAAPTAVAPYQPNPAPGPTLPYPPNGIGMAFGRWSSASPTGARSAAITTPSSSVGDLIALNVPSPVTCPKLRILNQRISFSVGRQRQSGPLLKAGPNGLVPIRLHCQWTAPCVGAIGVFSVELVWLVAGDITVPAGQTRTLELSTCSLNSSCPGRRYAQPILNQSHTVEVAIQIIAATSNGQLIPAARNIDRVGELEINRR
jgi:hypothetical protein